MKGGWVLVEKEIEENERNRPISKFDIYSTKIFRISTSNKIEQLNSYVKNNHFKMEGLFLLKELLEKGDYLCKLQSFSYFENF